MKQAVSRRLRARLLSYHKYKGGLEVRDAALDVVCDHYGCGPVGVLGDYKGRAVARPRQIVCWLISRYSNCGPTLIAKLMNRKDHATVIHAVRLVYRLRGIDPEFRDTVDLFEEVVLFKVGLRHVGGKTAIELVRGAMVYRDQHIETVRRRHD